MSRSGHLLLFLAKSLRLLDGKQQLLLQLLKALIRRQIQPVETGEQTNRTFQLRTGRPRKADGRTEAMWSTARTRCGSEEARCPFPPSQCRTSVARYFLQSERSRVRWLCVGVCVSVGVCVCV